MMLEQQISQKNAVQGRVALGMIHSAVSMLSDFQFSFLFFLLIMMMTLVVAMYHFLLAHGLSQASNFTVPSFASKISTTFFPNYNFNLWQQTLSVLISYMSLIYTKYGI